MDCGKSCLAESLLNSTVVSRLSNIMESQGKYICKAAQDLGVVMAPMPSSQSLQRLENPPFVWEMAAKTMWNRLPKHNPSFVFTK
ncbi:hypothetical protein ACTXT7_001651 [Hymenolepis weldensis]